MLRLRTYRGRQIDLHSGSAADFAADGNCPAVLLDDPFCDRKPESAPLFIAASRTPGSIEPVKASRQFLRTYPDTVVSDYHFSF